MTLSRKNGYVQISRLILDADRTDPRNEIHNALFELGIFSNMKLKEWLTLEDVADSVSHELGVEKYPLEPLRRAAIRLRSENRVRVAVQDGSETYALVTERSNQIEKSRKEVSDLCGKVSQSLIDSVKSEFRELTRADTELITEVFDKTISSMFSVMENASLAVLLSKGEPSGIGKDVRIQFGRHLGIVQNQRLQRIVREKMRRMILEPSDELKRFFAFCASNSFLMKLLNVDPECQSLQRERFSEYRVYLDTNILVSAMFEADDRCIVSREVLEETRKLGFKLVVTERTLDELEKVIDRSDKIYSRQRKNASRSKFYTPENTIIQTFVRYAEPDGDKWETFISSHKRFRSGLLGKYQIELDSKNYKDGTDETKFNEASLIVRKCSKTRLIPKSEEVIEHDAYHFLAMERLRLESESNKIWFLSHDSSFDCVNREIMRLEGSTLPYSILCSSWLEVIFPFLSPDVSGQPFEDVFARVIGSDFFAATKTFAFGNLTGFFAPFWNDEYLTDEDYIAILDDQILRRMVAEWEADGFSSAHDSEIAERIAALVDARKDERLATQDREIEKLKLDNEKLERRLSSMESRIGGSEESAKAIQGDLNTEIRKAKRVTWIAQGIICAFGAAIILLLLLLFKPENIYQVSAIVVFGAFAVGVSLKALKWLSGRAL